MKTMKKKTFLLLLVVMLLSLLVANNVSADCYASTYCPNLGTSIWCRTYDGPYGACSFDIVPGYSVSCTGYNLYGYWDNMWLTCY